MLLPNVIIRPSLAPKQKDLLFNAKDMIKDFDDHNTNNSPEFVFADIHGNIQLKLKEKSKKGLFVPIRSLEQLSNLLQSMKSVPITDKLFEEDSSRFD